MNNLNINTFISCEPKDQVYSVQPVTLITRGASHSFVFDLSTKAYTFDQIEQLIFIFGDQEKIVKSFSMYKEEPLHGETCDLEARFSHTSLGSQDCITFVLSAEDTAAFEVTDTENWLSCEVVIKIDGDDFSDVSRPTTTIIEKQPAIGVIDSLYGHLLGE